MRILIVFSLIILMTFTSCGEEDYTPKPRIYPKIEFPERAYKNSETNFCAFTFQQPVATNIEQKEKFFEEQALNACWFTMTYPALNGSIYFTYAPITKENPLYKLVDDAYKLEEQHLSKAAFIEHSQVIRPDAKVYGEITELGGNVGTPFQFFITDSVNHFVRAGLTFNAQSNADSLAPAVQYVKDDMMKLLETFQWND
jgi:gliding motility-associated lipoprotein GldD